MLAGDITLRSAAYDYLLIIDAGADVPSSANNLTNAPSRIGLWFGALLVAVTLFSVIFNLVFNRTGFNRADAVFGIFRVTMIFAVPVWLLCLPLVIALKNTEGRRIWTILVGGILIGPASLALWCFIAQRSGGNPDRIWHGDPLIGIGCIAGMLFALIVGFLTTGFYVIGLKVLQRRRCISEHSDSDF